MAIDYERLKLQARRKYALLCAQPAAGAALCAPLRGTQRSAAVRRSADRAPPRASGALRARALRAQAATLFLWIVDVGTRKNARKLKGPRISAHGTSPTAMRQRPKGARGSGAHPNGNAGSGGDWGRARRFQYFYRTAPPVVTVMVRKPGYGSASLLRALRQELLTPSTRDIGTRRCQPTPPWPRRCWRRPGMAPCCGRRGRRGRRGAATPCRRRRGCRVGRAR